MVLIKILSFPSQNLAYKPLNMKKTNPRVGKQSQPLPSEVLNFVTYNLIYLFFFLLTPRESSQGCNFKILNGHLLNWACRDISQKMKLHPPSAYETASLLAVRSLQVQALQKKHVVWALSDCPE